MFLRNSPINPQTFFVLKLIPQSANLFVQKIGFFNQIYLTKGVPPLMCKLFGTKINSAKGGCTPFTDVFRKNVFDTLPENACKTVDLFSSWDRSFFQIRPPPFLIKMISPFLTGRVLTTTSGPVGLPVATILRQNHSAVAAKPDIKWQNIFPPSQILPRQKRTPSQYIGTHYQILVQSTFLL